MCAAYSPSPAHQAQIGQFSFVVLMGNCSVQIRVFHRHFKQARIPTTHLWRAFYPTHVWGKRSIDLCQLGTFNQKIENVPWRASRGTRRSAGAAPSTRVCRACPATPAHMVSGSGSRMHGLFRVDASDGPPRDGQARFRIFPEAGLSSLPPITNMSRVPLVCFGPSVTFRENAVSSKVPPVA